MLKDYGDEVFDVIVLEFIGPHIQYTLKLVTRLKHRFPDALFVFLDMWLLMMWQHVPSGKIMAGWSSEQGLTSRGLGQTPQALDKVVTDLTKPEDWIYKTTHMYTKEQVQLLQRYGPVVHPPLPDNVYKAVQINFLFVGDMAHYTEDGHMYVVHHIRNELATQNFRKHHINTI